VSSVSRGPCVDPGSQARFKVEPCADGCKPYFGRAEFRQGKVSKLWARLKTMRVMPFAFSDKGGRGVPVNRSFADGVKIAFVITSEPVKTAPESARP
jgi:hypothetical protein